MITVARPLSSEKAHWYFDSGVPCHTVPNKSKGGERTATLRDAKTMGLLPSPTSICKILHREALVQWQIEQAVLACVSSPRREGEELDAFIERVLHIDKEHEQERDVAALKGGEIHVAIQSAVFGEPFTPALDGFVKPALVELNTIGRALESEKVLVNKLEGYAGTTDLLMENPEEIWVVDHKTCKRIPEKQYNEHRLQLAAYAGALGNTGNKRIRCANLYISTTEPGQVKLTEVENWPADFSRFKLLLRYWRLTNNFPMPEPCP